jgi:hypothetical protein
MSDIPDLNMKNEKCCSYVSTRHMAFRKADESVQAILGNFVKRKVLAMVP